MAPPILCIHGDLYHITHHHHPLTRQGARNKPRPQASIINHPLTVRRQAGTLPARQLNSLIGSATPHPQSTITPPHLTTGCEAGRKPNLQASNILTTKHQTRATPHPQAPLTHQTLTVRCQARTPEASQYRQFLPGHTAGWSEVQQLWHC